MISRASTCIFANISREDAVAGNGIAYSPLNKNEVKKTDSYLNTKSDNCVCTVLAEVTTLLQSNERPKML
ncbi:hypothetical protein CHX27_02970 [Flavobacterium aurantiibacter]|uniref:Uncharacterized protein n=1 Tax=Flavobacterium aurantiibacter TaxID=2023067 RepID=A0A256A159_9FLAO|nr:hypothetical protein CHX27_02970 [Flavobacterium aurantiibacter]